MSSGSESEVACPDEGTLIRLAEGLLPEQQAATLAAHTESCESCRLIVGMLMLRDTRPAARPIPNSSLDESTEKSGQEPPISGETVLPLADGRYHVDPHDLTALLGRGGQATVWRAYDKVLRREVALKRLHTIERPGVVAAFLREARLTAILEHPGIVPLHDVGREADGSIYLALRRIEGKSLADTLAAANGLDGRLAQVPALVRACQAVAFAHEHGVVHRDLKPQNIMLGRFGETYVLDWGLALVESRPGAPDVTAPTKLGGVVGTPAYMSPEQALGLPADARSDVWGLGACLYQLLTGKPPITGGSLQSAMGHASAGEIASVHSLEPRAPEDLAAICEKAVAAERNRRYANATALAADLEAWLAGRTVSARSYTRGQLLIRALGANRGAVALVGSALLVLGVVLGGAQLRIRQERNEARAFARELIRELPRDVDASRMNIELINSLTTRTQRWLNRTDLSLEELEESCDVLERLASFNVDAAAWGSARELYARELELSARGLELSPGNPLFVACELKARSGAGYCEVEAGDPARGAALFEAAWQRLQAWKGELTPEMRVAHSELALRWGNWAWERDPALARRLFIDQAQVVLPLLESPVPRIHRTALGRGVNAVTSLWAEGRLTEAVALAKRFYEAAAPECADPSLQTQRVCLVPLTSYASVIGWVDAPEADAVRQQALSTDAFVHAHDVDSVADLYDSTLMFLEQGLYADATARLRALRLTDSAAWGKELGPFSSALAGDLSEVDAWAPLAEESVTGGQLGLGLREAARGRYAEAARHLRAVKQDRLWYDISWSPNPRPKLALPPAAQPAFERFLAQFTRAYGAADMKQLGAAVDELATSFEALITLENP